MGLSDVSYKCFSSAVLNRIFRIQESDIALYHIHVDVLSFLGKYTFFLNLKISFYLLLLFILVSQKCVVMIRNSEC